ncbi:MAG: ferrochelatase [Gammaproteobacteria bacterium]
MPHYQNTEHFEHDTPARTGILLVNLGTPDAPDSASVRRYLAEFLADPRVVELPRWLWWLALHGIILRIRPPRVARAYQSVWTDAGSPLLAISKTLHAALQQNLQQASDGQVVTALAMRYGNPSIAAGLEALRQQNVQRLLVLPLYPQYSATTTAAVFDAVTSVLQHWRWIPETRFINQYHDAPAYIEALAASVRAHWQAHGQAEKLLFSFHGIPQRYHHAGDPYYCHCQKTARLLAEKLALTEDQWQTTFQSRFGREPWLQPYTDDTLKAWGRSGIKHVQVVCPGFSIDCLETLEEIAHENRQYFIAAGGHEYEYIPALNASSAQLQLLQTLIAQHTQGW